MPPSGLRPIGPVASLLGRSGNAADTLPPSRLATGQIGRNERMRIYEIDHLVNWTAGLLLSAGERRRVRFAARFHVGQQIQNLLFRQNAYQALRHRRELRLLTLLDVPLENLPLGLFQRI